MNDDSLDTDKMPANVAESSSAAAPDAPDDFRDPMEVLATEFSQRHRRGENPSVEEYARAYPELAEEIRELLPTIAAMEQIKTSKQRRAPSHVTIGGLQIERLGDFRILGEIGRGGMGVVYEAEQISLGRHVAVKVLPKQALLDERQLKRFQREAQAAAKLHHTNIVPVFGVGEQDGYHYIVMQFIAGVGLDEVMLALRRIITNQHDGTPAASSEHSRASHASHNAQSLLAGEFRKRQDSGAWTLRSPGQIGSGPWQANSDPTLPAPTNVMDADSIEPRAAADDVALDQTSLNRVGLAYWRSVAGIGIQVAEALQYAHEQGTLHRDIKPGNLLLDATGTVWVADFGLAKIAEHENVSHTGDVVGTLAYMPPESFRGQTEARSDIYSLGLSLYELLALRPAFDNRDRGQLVQRITQGELAPPRRYNPLVPRDLETIVLKAIAHEPKDRYATAGDFAADLQRFLDDRPILARRASPPERLWRWCRRNRVVATLAASVLSLLVLGTVGLSLSYWQVTNALTGEAEQRRLAQQTSEELKVALARAQRTSELAMGALDTIYDRLWPSRRLPVTSESSIQSSADAVQEDNEDLLVPTETAQDVIQPMVNAEMAALLEHLLPTYDELAADAGEDLKTADAALKVGEVQHRLGRRDEAIRAFQRAIDKYATLLKSRPGEEVLIGLASAYNELGNVWGFPWGSREEATDAHAKALELLQKNDAILAGSSRAKYELARTLFFMSESLGGPPGRRGGGGRGPRGGPDRGGPDRGGPDRGAGRPDGGPGRGGDPRRGDRGPGRGGPPRPETDRHLDQAIAVLKELIQKEPAPDYRYLLARCYLKKDRPRGRRSAGEGSATREAIGILEELASSHPRVSDYQYELAMAYAFSRRPEDEENRLRDAVNILDRLSREQGSIPQYVGSHLMVRSGLAQSLLRQKKWQQAIPEYERLVEVVAQHHERSPDQRPPFFFRRGFVPGAGIARDIAEEDVEAAGRHLEGAQLAAFQRQSAVSALEGLGSVLDAMRAKIGAVANQSTQLSSGLTRLWTDVQFEWIETRIELARVLWEAGESDRASTALEEASDELQETESRITSFADLSATSDPDLGRDLAQTVLARSELRSEMAKVLLSAGKTAPARQVLADAREHVQRFIDQLHPGDDVGPETWQLAQAHRCLSEILQLQGDETAAQTAQEQARELLRRNRTGRPPE